MNPLTNMRNVTKLSEQELKNSSKSSWHDQYKDSAWIFIGGLPYDLTEGDIICIFSQYGEVVNINLIRAKDTGKSKGFCFLCYEDQRSTILAVDNFNGIKILNRTLRVDHVQDYKVPKEGKKTDEETKKLYAEGCAPKSIAPVNIKKEVPKTDLRETLADQIEGDIKLPARLPIYTNIKDEKISDNEDEKKLRKEKKEKKKKKDKKKKSKKKKSKKSDSDTDEESNSSASESERNNVKTKKERSSRLGSEERDRSREHDRDRNERDKYNEPKFEKDNGKASKYSSSSRSEKYSSSKDYHSSKSRDQKSPPRRNDRAGSRDRSPRNYKRDVSPNIPKRWR